jgi:DMSO/TMAO reductase YedYZ heme-binding membrane subunit
VRVTGAGLATVGHGSTALWYLTRSTGLVALVLLSGTVVLGTVSSVGWTTARWPRFLSQSLHRNLSVFCLALVGIHVVSTVGDGYVPIGLADAVIPFRSPYRPIWVGLGALAFDMLLAVAVTSGLRRRIGPAAWRGVHWLAYACWPLAAVHGLGAGSDARLPGAQLVVVGCLGAVVAAAGWRVAVGRASSRSRRIAAGATAVAATLAVAVFALAGPLRPGWSHRAGTSPSLLAALSGASAASYRAGTAPSTAPSAPAATPALPSVPFSTTVTGTVSTSAPDTNGESVVTLTLHLADASDPLVAQIAGPAVNGGVEMRRSSVSFGAQHGVVTALDGSTVAAVVGTPSAPLDLAMQLSLDPSAGTVTGQVSGTAGR